MGGGGGSAAAEGDRDLGRRPEGGAVEVSWPPSDGCVGLDTRRGGRAAGSVVFFF